MLGSLDLMAIGADGIQWDTDSLGGWGAPAGTLTVAQKPRQAGGWAGSSYAKPRSVTISGEAIVPSTAASSAAVDALTSATSLDSTTLTITEGGEARSCIVRRDGDVIVTWPIGAPTLMRWSIQLVAPDPRKFGTPLTGSTALPSSSGGLTVPFTVPFSIGATTVSGQIALTNPGNVTGPVSLRIDGPVTGPVVTHVGTGRALVFASSLVLGAGEFVTVDMERREVLAQGQSSRSGWVTSRGWSGFQPGGNVWSFSAQAYDAGSLLTVNATPAWE